MTGRKPAGNPGPAAVCCAMQHNAPMSAPSPNAAELAAPALPVGPRQRALILTGLSLGGFGIGTSEFASMGLMPNLVADLGVSEPQVGHLISTYALGVVVGAPLLAILGGRLSRKALLLDRKSTRLNSSHVKISYAVFCLKKKKKYT